MVAGSISKQSRVFSFRNHARKHMAREEYGEHNVSSLLCYIPTDKNEAERYYQYHNQSEMV